MEHIVVCFRPIPVQTSSQENWRKEHPKITNLFKNIKAVNWKENTNIPIFWKDCIRAQFAQNDKNEGWISGDSWSVYSLKCCTRALKNEAVGACFLFSKYGFLRPCWNSREQKRPITVRKSLKTYFVIGCFYRGAQIELQRRVHRRSFLPQPFCTLHPLALYTLCCIS